MKSESLMFINGPESFVQSFGYNGFGQRNSELGFVTGCVDMKMISDEGPVEGRLDCGNKLILEDEGCLGVVTQMQDHWYKIPKAVVSVPPPDGELGVA